MDSVSEQDERLANELALLEAMYPEHVTYQSRARELGYNAGRASFTLRLPDGYLQDALPEVLAASDGVIDARDKLKRRIEDCSPGEEMLDTIILAFCDLVDECRIEESGETRTHAPAEASSILPCPRVTIVVWLHHLLNTNKRKQALSPPSAEVSGVTKPGYPGVLVYSGPASAVHEHVNELKQQNWQAFQVRLESEEEWHFAHGAGVREVEAMKEVVAEVGAERKEAFMEAMRMK